MMKSWLFAATVCAAQLVHAESRTTGIGHYVDRAFEWLAQKYRGVLERGLRFPIAVIASMFLLVGAAYVVFKNLPTEFVPSQDQSRLMVRLTMAVGSPLGSVLIA